MQQNNLRFLHGTAVIILTHFRHHNVWYSLHVLVRSFICSICHLHAVQKSCKVRGLGTRLLVLLFTCSFLHRWASLVWVKTQSMGNNAGWFGSPWLVTSAPRWALAQGVLKQSSTSSVQVPTPDFQWVLRVIWYSALLGTAACLQLHRPTYHLHLGVVGRRQIRGNSSQWPSPAPPFAWGCPACSERGWLTLSATTGCSRCSRISPVTLSTGSERQAEKRYLPCGCVKLNFGGHAHQCPSVVPTFAHTTVRRQW